MKLLPVTDYLSSLLEEAFDTLNFSSDLAYVTLSKQPQFADYQCNAAMALAKAEKQPPRNIAQSIVDQLNVDPSMIDVSIAGAGFINFKLKDSFLESALSEMTERANLGFVPHEGKTYVMDYGGYNIAKALHFGHLRSTVLGDVLGRLFSFKGDKVISDVHLGDWGTQMGQLIEAVRKEQPNLPYFDADFEGEYPEKSPVNLADLNRLYPAASALCKKDDAEKDKARLATAELQSGRKGYVALWRHFVAISLEELKADIAPFGVEFDLWLGESDVQPLIPDMVAQLVESGVAYEDEGALVISVSAEIGRKVAALMLQKSDGASTYGTTDLATIVSRVQEYNPDGIIYLTDGRQREHFEQVFAAVEKGSLAPDSLGFEHLWFGTINGTDGKPFKTRSGDTVKLRDVTKMVVDLAYQRLEESGKLSSLSEEQQASAAHAIGMATIKFAELSNDRTTSYILDLDTFSKPEGKTGPYLLYSVVRARSILEQATGADLTSGQVQLTCAQDHNLALKLLDIHRVIQIAYDKREPHHLCLFAFELAQAFSAFYKECHILKESNADIQSGWLSLCQMYLKQMTLILEILGIPVPEKM